MQLLIWVNSYYFKLKLLISNSFYYLKNGADVECVDNNGKNALSYAKISNSQECMQLLLFNGSQDNDLNSSIGNSNGHQNQNIFTFNSNNNHNNIFTTNNHINTLTRRSQSTSSNSHIAYEKLPFNVV